MIKVYEYLKIPAEFVLQPVPVGEQFHGTSDHSGMCSSLGVRAPTLAAVFPVLAGPVLLIKFNY
jgi:hypothetical protein